MSRSGYSDDSDDYEGPELYRRAVENALNGKRGQAFLRELLEAFDALDEKKLIEGYLKDGDRVCAIGAVGVRRGVDMSRLDPEDSDSIGRTFGIARCLVAEIAFVNDDEFAYFGASETDEHRFQRVRKWVVENIKESVQ